MATTNDELRDMIIRLSGTITDSHLKLHGDVVSMKERLNYVATRDDLHTAIDAHKKTCAGRPSLIARGRNNNSFMLKAVVAALIALAGVVVALTEFLK